MAQQIRYYKQDGTEYSFSKELKIKIMQTSNADMNIGIPKKITAVKFLVELLPQIDWDDPYYRGILQEAKQMEKEQIIKAASLILWHNSANSTEEAEQYYNDTYGQK